MHKLAFDNKSIDDMMPLYSTDIKTYNFHDKSLISEGIKDCRKIFTEIFNNSQLLHTEILIVFTMKTKLLFMNMFMEEMVTKKEQNK